jgi:hypothetical protein
LGLREHRVAQSVLLRFEVSLPALSVWLWLKVGRFA